MPKHAEKDPIPSFFPNERESSFSIYYRANFIECFAFDRCPSLLAHFRLVRQPRSQQAQWTSMCRSRRSSRNRSSRKSSILSSILSLWKWCAIMLLNLLCVDCTISSISCISTGKASTMKQRSWTDSRKTRSLQCKCDAMNPENIRL